MEFVVMHLRVVDDEAIGDLDVAILTAENAIRLETGAAMFYMDDNQQKWSYCCRTLGLPQHQGPSSVSPQAAFPLSSSADELSQLREDKPHELMACHHGLCLC